MFPVYKTDRILLRKIISTDIENVFKGLSNPSVIKYYGVSYDTLESTKTQMSWFDEIVNNKTGIWWAICSPDNTIFYGAAGINNIDSAHKKAEIGYWLLPDYWGRGFVAEALSIICRYGFEKEKLHRIESFVETENQNSIKVMNALDFEHEGTLKECEIKNGKYINLHIFAKINQNL